MGYMEAEFPQIDVVSTHLKMGDISLDVVLPQVRRNDATVKI